MKITLKPVTHGPATAKNTCGACSMCCLLLGVVPLEKKPNTWCPHVEHGCGCGIYSTRPGVCRDFECLWLASSWAAPELRPDRIHGMLTATTNGQHLVVHEHPSYPGFAHAKLKPMLDKWIADGTRYYVVTCGTRPRKFFGNPDLLPAARAMMDEQVAATTKEK